MSSVPINTKMKGLSAMLGVPVGGGFSLPPAAEITATDMDDVPYDVTFDVELVEGRYECVSLTCTRKEGGEPVTTNGIRAVPIGRIIGLGLERNIMKWKPNPHAEGESVGAPVGHSDDESVRVAAVYRLAYACGLPPTSEVASALGVSQSVAGNRVMRARKAGLLDPTVKGRAQAGGPS